MTEITRIIFAFDRDVDMTIDLREVDELARQVTSSLETRGIELDIDKFKAMIRMDNNISHVLKGKSTSVLARVLIILADSSGSSGLSVIGALMFEDSIEEGSRKRYTRLFTDHKPVRIY